MLGVKVCSTYNLLGMTKTESVNIKNMHQVELRATRTVLQSNLSIPDTWGPNKTVLIIEVSLFQRFINTHYYCIGTATTYRGVLILDCAQ